MPRRVLKEPGVTALVAFATIVLEDADLEHAVNGMLYGIAIRTLNQHMKEILKMPDLVAKVKVFGALPAGKDLDGLAKTNAGNHARFAKIVKDFGIQTD